MADTAAALASWSTTVASNLPISSTTIGAFLAPNLGTIQSAMRWELGTRGTIASATTTDLATKQEGTVDVSGTTTITSFGTVSAGMRKRLVFGGILTLTYNATSMVLPTSASITTAAGDWADFISLGSGNWECMYYSRKSGQTVAAQTTFQDGTVALPGIAFSSDLDTGFYRVGANNWAGAAGGVKKIDVSTTAIVLTPTNGATYSFADILSLLSAAGQNATLASADSTGTTGAVTVATGNGTGGTGDSGALTLKSGTGNIVSGAVSLKSGDVSSSAGPNVGAVTVASGDRVSAAAVSSVANGDVNLRVGYAAYIGAAPVHGLNFQHRAGGATVTMARLNGQSGCLEFLAAAGTPTVTGGTGGAGVSISGTNYCFVVVFGTGAGTTLNISLAAWPGSGLGTVVPTATYQGASAITARLTSSSASALVLELSSAPANAEKLMVNCAYFK